MSSSPSSIRGRWRQELIRNWTVVANFDNPFGTMINQKNKLESDINHHLDFLIKDYGFVKIPTYQNARELNTDYVKDGLIINLICDSSFWANILIPKIDIGDILSGNKKVIDYEYFKDFKVYSIKRLDFTRSTWKKILNDKKHNKGLRYAETLLKNNPDVLNGKLSKLKWPIFYFLMNFT